MLKKRFPDLFKYRSEYYIHPKKIGRDDLGLIIKLRLEIIKKLTEWILKVLYFLEDHFAIELFNG